MIKLAVLKMMLWLKVLRFEHMNLLGVARERRDEAGMDVLMSGDNSTRFSPTTFGGTGAAAAGPTALDTGRHFASCSAVL